MDLGEHQVKKVRIRGFRSIREQTVHLGRVNVLLGSNGAGKSNLFSAFELLSEILKGNLGTYSAQQGLDALLYRGIGVTNRISMEFVFGNDTGYGFELSPADDGRLIFKKEFCCSGGVRTPILEERHAESAWASSEPGQMAICTALRGARWNIYRFCGASLEVCASQAQDKDNNVRLQSNAGNLAAILYRLKRDFPESYMRIIEMVQMAAPYFKDFHLEPEDLGTEKIRLRWKEKGRSGILNGALLSGTTLRFIGLTTLLMQPESLRPDVIIIEEPEAGLHPFVVNIVSELVRKASFTSQVLLSTQSPELLDNFEPEDILVVNREGNGTTFSRLDAQELAPWLKSHSLGELWKKNLFGGRLAR